MAQGKRKGRPVGSGRPQKPTWQGDDGASTTFGASCLDPDAAAATWAPFTW